MKPTSWGTMQFNSVTFLVFLPVIVVLYYLIPHKYRWMLLLAGSYYFYACWRIDYIILIITSTLVDYFCGILIAKYAERRKRLLFLIASLVINLGLLFAFKYYNFAIGSANFLLEEFNFYRRFEYSSLLLPVGISFYTFQSLSYTIDVYLRNLKPEKHLGYFALYVSFFPQLVAGPIERFDRLTPQLRARHKISYENFSHGFRLIIYGLFIKMVIADNLSVYVEQVYDNPSAYNSISILTALVFYSFQIYSDFYGYSLIALGSARFIGINLMDNFKTPYLARNISEFWQRWHISLSTWFRDYLYIPLGGNKVKLPRWIMNILLVFLISGIWHGANWTFVIWGGIFGIAYLAEHFLNKQIGLSARRNDFKPWHIILVLKTFIIVTIAWVFFRSENLEKAFTVFQSLVSNVHVADTFYVKPSVLIFFVLFVLSDVLLYNSRFDLFSIKLKPLARWSVYGVLIVAIILFAGLENFPFIYFQF